MAIAQTVALLLRVKIFMQREFNVVIERDIKGYWIASVPALHGCHTQARSLDELMQRIEEAILLCLEVSITESGYQSNSWGRK
jgi:predicted RNase H-like HicB family nuclease